MITVAIYTLVGLNKQETLRCCSLISRPEPNNTQMEMICVWNLQVRTLQILYSQSRATIYIMQIRQKK